MPRYGAAQNFIRVYPWPSVVEIGDADDLNLPGGGLSVQLVAL